MSSDEEIVLCDICEAIVDCEHKTAPSQIEGIPLIRTTDIENGKLKLTQAKKISESTYKEWSKRLEPEAEDIILAREAPVGEVGFVPKKQRVCLGQRTVLIRINPKLAYPRYILYLLCSREVRQKMAGLATGSVVSHLNMEDIRILPIGKLPNLVQQRLIGDFLGALDDKIEVNQRMNRTLEAVGQTLFGRWFVDFEFPNKEGKPYKSSGGEMVYSEVLEKNIPQGWIVRELGEVIKFVKGKKPPMVSPLQQEGFQPHILIDALDGNLQSFAPTNEMVIVNVTDSIMVMDGASSGRIERGRQGVLGSTLAKIETHKTTNAYVYHFLKEKQEDVKQNTTGTSIPHADKSKIGKYLFVAPIDDSIMHQFETVSNILLLKAINNRSEIHTLQKIRDMLLVKLTSGKIRVPVVEEVETVSNA